MRLLGRRSTVIAVATVMALGGITGCSSVLNPGGAKAITIYSNSFSDGRADWLVAEAKKAGFEINPVELGGGDVYNRLVAEKANPVADVVIGLNDVYYSKLNKQGLLEQYTPSWADKVEPDSIPASKNYYPIVKEPIMLVCNTAGKSRPAGWLDLGNKPELKGRYEVPAALGGATTQVVLSSILARYRDDNGKIGVSEKGWKEVEKYYKNGSRSVQGTDLYARMKSGDVDCGHMWLAGKVTREKQYGVKTEATHPAEGVPMVRQYTSIIKGTKKAEIAKKFVDWFGGAEIQAKWSNKFFTAPTNKDALAQGDQEAIKFTNSFKEQKLDWAFIAANLDKWVEEIQLKYVK